MCYFHTSSTISCKLKCDISRFTHCIHEDEEMRSGYVYLQILCENKDNRLMAAVVAVSRLFLQTVHQFHNRFSKSLC